MRPLKLHLKTTLLASAIMLAVLSVLLLIISARVAELLRAEQKERVKLLAANLADDISRLPAPRDPERLARAANLVRGSRPDLVAVRVWERVSNVYLETAAAGSEPAAEIPEEIKTALRGGVAVHVATEPRAGVNNSTYRVFAPIKDDGRVSGAVEIVEHLDDAPSIAASFERTALWLAIGAVVLIGLTTYFLFRHLIYAPIEGLLAVMSYAEAGDLQVQSKSTGDDEIGLLGRGLNRMIRRVRAMTEEREAQRQLLEERVREATAELQHRNEQLEETSRELWQTTRRLTELERLAAAGQTAAQFAHEVGTPLNLISGHVQLLNMQLADDERAASRLHIINTQIERIERIVRGMLDRTRPEKRELSPLDLNALLKRIFDATAPLLDARNVRLVTELDEVLPLIDADADRLQQVFINLINNSLDAMPDGGELHIKTSTSAVEQTFYVDVSFADTGCGMSDEVRARAFDPLYTTKKAGRGTGLGLVVVNQVMREHQGLIEVESEADQGTRFLLRFPVSTAQEKDARENEATLAGQISENGHVGVSV